MQQFESFIFWSFVGLGLFVRFRTGFLPPPFFFFSPCGFCVYIWRDVGCGFLDLVVSFFYN